MGFKRKIAVAATCAALAVAANAAPPEPVMTTRLPDPDPTFVPPRAEHASHARRRSGEEDRLDLAMEEFGRAIGQAALIEKQQMAARCQAGESANATAEQRFAWAAACRYQRH